MGVLPVDPQLQKMNFHQWMWCYYNVVEDEKEEQEVIKAHLDRLAFIVNPDVAKSVFEHEKKQKRKSKKGSKSSQSKFEKEDPFQNNDFDIETRAAMLGYEPSMNITPQEFLEKYKEDQKVQKILDGDLDEIIDENSIAEIEESDIVGDPDEDPDDFLERAMSLRESFFDHQMIDEENSLKTAEDLEKDPQLIEEIFENERLRQQRINETKDDFDADVFEIEGDDE
jgi:hypothetical protein